MPVDYMYKDKDVGPHLRFCREAFWPMERGERLARVRELPRVIVVDLHFEVMNRQVNVADRHVYEISLLAQTRRLPYCEPVKNDQLT